MKQLPVSKNIHFLLFCLLTLLVPGSPVMAGTVEGIVLTPTGPAQEAVIYAYPDYASLAAGTNGIASQRDEKQGQYHFNLPPGTYFFEARGKANGKPVYSYHGVNPVVISDSYLWLPFLAVQQKTASRTVGPQGIGGRITYKGKGLSGGVVSVYPLPDKRFRGMGLLSNTIDPEGWFWFDLEEGTYVVIARKRYNDSGMGPLQKGDLFCYPAANPVSVSKETTVELEIPCYPKDDIEAFLNTDTLDPRGRKEKTRRVASLWDTPMQDTEEIRSKSQQQPTKVSGKVTDMSGRPLQGLYVTAYPADIFPFFQMYVVRRITKHIARTDTQGRYVMELQGDTSYYLVAREKIGEAPVSQEFYGLYEGNANHSIAVDWGKPLSKINIKADRIMPAVD